MCIREITNNRSAFYRRIGACRHGNKCVKEHIHPTSSYCVVLRNFFDFSLLKVRNEPAEVADETDKQNQQLRGDKTNEQNNDTDKANQDTSTTDSKHPQNSEPNSEPDQNDPYVKLKEIPESERFAKLLQDIFIELSLNYGFIEDIVICENNNIHLKGNVYIKFSTKESAANCNQELNNRWYNGRPIYSELSPVRSFEEATCRKHDFGRCERGDMCNYMHIKRAPPTITNNLFDSQLVYYNQRA